MTLEREAAAEVFGLSGTFPRPGWVVLDAARDHRFTGELIFDVLPEVRVYCERGEIYLAERPSDPSLGARLVDAGALNASQLERGGMRIGDAEHLGRLFERAPSVDRHAVLVTTEMMNDACVSWLARQTVRGVTPVPYHRHDSGIHRWDRIVVEPDLARGDPLPAPCSTEAPVEQAPPEPLFDDRTFSDGLVEWNEPSWLDERSPARSDVSTATSTDAGATSVPTGSGRTIDSDWIDMLAGEGLPERGDDPLGSPATLPPRSAPSPDRFELIWPSGEVDEEFGLADTADRDIHPDHDRAGPTARIGGFEAIDPSNPVIAGGAWDFENTPPSYASSPDVAGGADLESDDEDRDVTDQVVLSVRRAVASIETGSLAARRRLASHAPTATDPPIVPGRIATREEAAIGAASAAGHDPSRRSVFDEDSPTDVPPTLSATDAMASADEQRVEPSRVSALRRLIGGLRRN